MDPERMRGHLMRYAAQAQRHSALAEMRGTAMLGIMCVLAAAADRLIDVPEEWGWPRIPPVTE